MNRRIYRAFTLIELITAIAVFVIVIGFSSVVFQTSIGSYRTSNALTEVSEKFGVICDLLDKEFDNFERSGRLVITDGTATGRRVFAKKYGLDDVADAEMDSIYYYTTGEFQSLYKPDAWSNSARIFIGHSLESIDESVPANILPLSECELVRDVKLFTPGLVVTLPEVWPADCNSNGLAVILESWDNYDIDNVINLVPADMAHYLCDNVSDFKIEWTDGNYALNAVSGEWDLVWLNGSRTWDAGSNFPKVLKFTVRLYDSKGILRSGRLFSYIVRLER